MGKAEKAGAEKTVVATNHKRGQYEVFEVLEAGLSLKGPEVKSLRAGKAVLEGSFARVEGEEAFLHNMHIAPYAQNTTEEIAPLRTRKLLLRRRELHRLIGRQTKGLTLIPLELYFKNGWAKISLALAKGKRGPDKRKDLRDKDLSREMQRSFKGKFKI
ncbi:MAG: SsrA-binding protein SmpB [Elusimicrobiota bacterium]